MPLATRRNLTGAACAGAVLGLIGLSQAALADYPDRPISVMIAWGTGGATDVVTRALHPVLAEKLGTDLVIRNVAGAAGTIGTAEAAAADADGYNILVTPPGPLTIQPHLRELPYDLENFEAIGRINITPMMMMAAPDAPFHTLEDIVEQSRAEPNSVTFALTGAGTMPHISILALNEGARHRDPASALPRLGRGDAGAARRRGLLKEQVPILVAADRSGATLAHVLPDTTWPASRCPNRAWRSFQTAHLRWSTVVSFRRGRVGGLRRTASA